MNCPSECRSVEKITEEGYRPLYIDALNKVVNGTTTIEEVNKKLALY